MSKCVTKLVFIALAFLFFAGCTSATRFIPQGIAQQTPIALKTDTANIGDWSVPVGAYHIPGTSFVVLDDKPVSTIVSGVGAGAVGVIIHHSLEAGSQKKRLGDTERLYHLDMKRLIDEVLKQEIVYRPRFALAREGDKLGENSMLLKVYAYIGTTKDNQARIHTILETKIPAYGNKKRWWNRYIFYSENWRPLKGPESWTESDGVLIRAEVEYGLRQTLKFCLDDIFGTSPQKKVLSEVNAKYLGYCASKAIKAVVIEESNDRVIVQLKKGNLVTMEGIHFLPLSEVNIKNN